MAVTIELIRGPRCMTAKVAGVLDAQWVRGSEQMFREHLEMCAREGRTGLLYDLRGIEVRLGTVDLYEAGKSLASAPFAGIRIGVLARPDQVTPERFFERVALNRGAPVKVLTDEAQARAWLGCGPG